MNCLLSVRMQGSWIKDDPQLSNWLEKLVSKLEFWKLETCHYPNTETPSPHHPLPFLPPPHQPRAIGHPCNYNGRCAIHREIFIIKLFQNTLLYRIGLHFYIILNFNRFSKKKLPWWIFKFCLNWVIWLLKRWKFLKIFRAASLIGGFNVLSVWI